MDRKQLFYKLAFGRRRRPYKERIKGWAKIIREPLPAACPKCGKRMKNADCPACNKRYNKVQDSAAVQI